MFGRAIRVLTLSDSSIYSALAPREVREPARLLRGYNTKSATPETILDRVQQQRARIIYALSFIVFGVFAYAFKWKADSMFYYLKYDNFYSRGSFIMNEFAVAMVNRLALTIVVYHSAMFALNLYQSQESALMNDFGWLFKIMLFVEFFFVMCLAADDPFHNFAVVAKYFAMIFVGIKGILLTDAFYYYFCENLLNGKFDTRLARLQSKDGMPGESLEQMQSREQRIENEKARIANDWAKMSILGWVFGVAFAAAGIASFAYVYVVAKNSCTGWVVINSVLIGLTALFFLFHLMRYLQRTQVIAGLFAIFIFGSYSWGLVFGTPYSTCVNAFNSNLTYMLTVAHVDTCVRDFTRMGAYSAYFAVHFKREFAAYENRSKEQGAAHIPVHFGQR